ncbi:MAG: argininosuccinate lyase [Dehalococcoidia bacterium]|nr:MAG: argininosuccinate lyase [Dehalococcoidia bacterium]
MSHIRGRFQKDAAEAVVKYTTSLPFDKRMYKQDIRGSIAHARMLAKQGIISAGEGKALADGLKAVESEIESGVFVFKPELEDIHMAVEARLLELAGAVAGKLHTARSRNDQVALDMRLYVRDAIKETQSKVRQFQRSLVEQAEKNQGVLMPGYTHMQPAQPVLLSHHLLAYFEMLERDYERFSDAYKRADVMPLGSGALAGAAYNLDREFVARELGFSRISQNSLDAVSDRDFLIEYIGAASLCMVHISRMAEELVLWSSAEFGFVEMDDSYATASSIMPQKKNPDVAELGRGKAGRVFGHLMGMLTTMKGLPLSYNRDLQEDKEALFDTVDTLVASLEVFAGMVSTLEFKPGNMKRSLGNGYILATDVADYLVKKGLSFREAHGVTGRLVSYAIGCGKPLESLTIEEYKGFSPLFAEDVRSISAARSVASKNVPGGTAPGQVSIQLSHCREILG